MKQTYIFSLVLLILLLTACGGGSSGSADTKLQTGTKGVDMTLLKNLQSRIYEETEFYVRLELHNAGFEDVKRGVIVPQIEKDMLTIKDWELPPTFSMGSDTSVIYNLEGKSLNNPKGEKQTATLVLKTKKVDETRNKMESDIAFISCYPYRTTFSGAMCIDTDTTGENIVKKTCTAKDISAQSQGAPIAITKVEQTILPDSDGVRLQLDIFAENKGNGLIIDYDRYNDICLGRNPRQEDYDTIWIERVSFSDYEYAYMKDYSLDCYPNPMKPTGNGFHTQCVIKEGNEISKSKMSFQTMLVIELAYGYKDTLGSHIEILNKDQEWNEDKRLV